MAHFNLLSFPASNGDCLVVEYGKSRRIRRILIDGGTAGTYRGLNKYLEGLPEEERTFELLVITHIDADHIAGALNLLEDTERPVKFRDIWFNGWNELQYPHELAGARQGERVSDGIVNQRLPWNKAFKSKACVVGGQGPDPVTLSEGMKVRLLSPTVEELHALIPEWERQCKKAGITPGVATRRMLVPESLEVLGPLDIDALADASFKEDGSPSNGTSIAFLMEFGGKRILLAGDAHPSVLINGLSRLHGRKKVSLDLFKVPHHGSKNNVDAKLVKKLSCDTYLFSTNGAYHKHPDREGVARVIKYGGKGVRLAFNYRTEYTSIWDDPLLMEAHEYSVSYAKKGKPYSCSMLP
jgi:beta-lactamase superfamily II metal-dependent hydrolase